jgi:LAO/AO transport system kinase
MEMADMLVINKAEGDNLPLAKRAAVNYRNALHLFPAHPGSWTPLVQLCSAIDGSGVAAVWKSVESYFDLCIPNGYRNQKRAEQRLQHFHEYTRQRLEQQLLGRPAQQARLQALEKEVSEGRVSPYTAARHLLAGL